MPIRLHDSLTRTTKTLAPSHTDGVFRFYNCGPTVYAPAHIGNFRTFVVNDVLRRLLELEFPGKVKHVRNLTDVDDKTIRRSREEKRPLADVTRQWTQKFHDDCAALNCLPPHVEPTATGHIPEQIDMISALERRGHAYRADDGSVYFKVSSFPGYGALSRVKERELQPGSALLGKSQAADADEKEDLSDFALWKSHKPDDGDNFWPSPWGNGRPGWHIECSAMSKKHLGETIDLHTGGVDLLFPHHENEIAQSQCCNDTLFAHHWYHSEHLLVDGKKMSKSLGNLYTLDDLIAKGHTPAALRYALLAGHPRKQLNFALESLHAAESALKTLTRFHKTLMAATRAGEIFKESDEHAASIKNAKFFYNLFQTPGARIEFKPEYKPSKKFDAVFEALWDDLNTPAAFGVLFGIINQMKPEEATLQDFIAFATVTFAIGLELTDEPTIHAPEAVRELASQRWAAKQAKDFKLADTLRAELAAAGWTMLDRKDGYSLEPLKK